MKNENSAMTCKQVKEQFKDLLSDRLSDEVLRAYIQGHILGCDACAEEWFTFVEQHLDILPEVPIPAAPPVEAPRRCRYREMLDAEARGYAWAREALRRLREAMALLAGLVRPRYAGAHLGPDDGWPEAIQIPVVDLYGNRQEPDISCSIVKKPTYHETTFECEVSGSENADRLVNDCTSTKLLCTVNLPEGLHVTFEGIVERGVENGWQAKITERGLKSQRNPVVIPPEQVQLCLEPRKLQPGVKELEEARSILLAALQDENASVRADAAKGLGLVGACDAEVLKELDRVAGQDGDKNVREAAKTAANVLRGRA